MLNKKILAVAIATLGLAGTAQAASFLNGGFENNDTSGWTTGGGYWSDSSYTENPSDYFVGGSHYNPGYAVVTVTSAGTDAYGQSEVRYGNHAVKLNDTNNNYSVSVIKQSVTNYAGTSINFAWDAVLEGSHGLTDSDNFTLKVTDDTAGTTVYDAAYSSASAAANVPGAVAFTNVPYTNVYVSGWQDITLASTVGHDYTVELLASDCPYGGHWGYVYLDGFGTVAGGPGDNGTPSNATPEPGSLLLVGIGLTGALAARRRRKAA